MGQYFTSCRVQSYQPVNTSDTVVDMSRKLALNPLNSVDTGVGPLKFNIPGLPSTAHLIIIQYVGKQPHLENQPNDVLILNSDYDDLLAYFQTVQFSQDIPSPCSHKWLDIPQYLARLSGSVHYTSAPIYGVQHTQFALPNCLFRYRKNGKGVSRLTVDVGSLSTSTQRHLAILVKCQEEWFHYWTQRHTGVRPCFNWDRAKELSVDHKGFEPLRDARVYKVRFNLPPILVFMWSDKDVPSNKALRNNQVGRCKQLQFRVMYFDCEDAVRAETYRGMGSLLVYCKMIQ